MTKTTYSAEPICLTVTMVQMAGMGWHGAELFVFKKEAYQGNVMYACPETCEYSSEWGKLSCDTTEY